MNKRECTLYKLVDFAKITKGKKPRKELLRTPFKGCQPYILIENFDKNYNIFSDDPECVKCNPQDILIVWDGERAGLTTFGHSGFIGSTLAAITVLNSNIDPNYVFWNIVFNQKKLRAQAEGTGVPHLSKWSVNSVQILGLPIKEQRKIAAILTSVDEVIEKTQAQINKLKDLKKAMMQELLTKGIGHTEFKDSPVGRIPKEWEVIPIRKLGEIVTGFTPSTKEKKYWNGDIPFVCPADCDCSKYVMKTNRKVTKLGAKQGRILPQNSILVTCIGSTIGKMAMINQKSITNQQINSIICNDRYNPTFIYYSILQKVVVTL